MTALLAIYGGLVTMIALWLFGEVRELHAVIESNRQMRLKAEERAKQWELDSGKKDREISRLAGSASVDAADYKVLASGVRRALETGSLDPLRRVMLQATRGHASAGASSGDGPVQGAGSLADDIPTKPGRPR